MAFSGQPLIKMTATEVAALGTGLAALMSIEQLKAAAVLVASILDATTTQNVNSTMIVHRTFMNHLQRCIRMPAGGAHAGGSQQTGFEMELVSPCAASEMFASWPNAEVTGGGRRRSWELRTMQELADHLALEQSPAGWGALQGKPMPLLPRREHHMGVILVGPPFTVTWAMRPDETTVLCARFPLILWSEEDAIILPPRRCDGGAFLSGPTRQTWATQRSVQNLDATGRGGAFDPRLSHVASTVISHLPSEYQSDSECTLSEGVRSE